MAKEQKPKTEVKNKTVTYDVDTSMDKVTAIHDHHTTGEVVVKELFGVQVHTIY